MSKTFTIGGTDYEFPVQGDSPPWGEEVTDTVGAIVDVINTVNGTGDILVTTFSLANNVSVDTNVTGLTFDPSQVRTAVISYSIDRSTDSTELSEGGTITIAYNSMANSWEQAQRSVGNAGVVFSVGPSGQFTYQSSNLSGSGYVGTLKFSAKAFTQS